jgi:hypothetical protein
VISRNEYGWAGGSWCPENGPNVIDLSTKPSTLPDSIGKLRASWQPAILCQRWAVWMLFPDEKNIPVLFQAISVESTFNTRSGGVVAPYKFRFKEIWVVFADCWTTEGNYKEPSPPPGNWPYKSSWNMIAYIAGKAFGGTDESKDARYLVWEPI